MVCLGALARPSLPRFVNSNLNPQNLMIKKLIALSVALLLAVASWAAVNANTADEAALRGVKGLGKKAAAAIVAERTANGPFKDFADLTKRVKHIGKKRAAKLQAEGLVVEPAEAPAAAPAAPAAGEKAAK